MSDAYVRARQDAGRTHVARPVQKRADAERDLVVFGSGRRLGDRRRKLPDQHGRHRGPRRSGRQESRPEPRTGAFLLGHGGYDGLAHVTERAAPAPSVETLFELLRSLGSVLQGKRRGEIERDREQQDQEDPNRAHRAYHTGREEGFPPSAACAPGGVAQRAAS